MTSRAPKALPDQAADTFWQMVAWPEPSARGRWLAAAMVASIVAGLLSLLAWRSEPGVSDWAAELALRIHHELDDDHTVTLEPAAPPPPAPLAPSAPPPAPSPSTVKARPTKAPAKALPAAGPVAAQALAGAAKSEPLDYSAVGFVAGQSATPASGAVSASAPHEGGMGQRGPGEGDGAGTSSGRGALARPVSLSQEDWDCPWPASADEHDKDEARVDLSVEVATDGHVTGVRILRDPGNGFGAAARTCALHTTFTAARDNEGQLVTAWSPTIRVTFRR